MTLDTAEIASDKVWVDESGENIANTLEVIDLGGGMSILRLPDKDGKPIYIPSYRVSNFEGKEFYPPELGDRNKVLRDLGLVTDMAVRSELTAHQQERLVFALENLRLPVILAVHLALNREDLDLKTLRMPNDNTPYPVTLAIIGRPGVGKSFLVALLSYNENYPIINLDSSSGVSSLRYREELQKEGGKKELTVAEAREVFSSLEQERGIKKSDREDNTTLRLMLDKALQWALNNENRSSLYLVDLPGIPGEYDYKTGRSHGKPRPLDIFDLVAVESCESMILNTHQLTDETMQRKLEWVKSLIGERIEDWKFLRGDFLRAIK